MWTVDQSLITGVGVNGGHQTLLNTERIVENLDHRHEAVGGARSVGDDVVTIRVVRVVVDTDYKGGITVAGWGRDDDLRRASRAVHAGSFLLGEDAGRLDDNVDTKVAPREFRWVADRENLQDVTVDTDSVANRFDLAIETAVN